MSTVGRQKRAALPRPPEGGAGRRSVLPGLRWPKIKIHPWVCMNSWSCTPSLSSDPSLQPLSSGHSGVINDGTFNFTERDMSAQPPSVRDVSLETKSCRNSEHEYFPQLVCSRMSNRWPRKSWRSAGLISKFQATIISAGKGLMPTCQWKTSWFNHVRTFFPRLHP